VAAEIEIYMSNARRVLRTEFGPESRFEVSPLPAAPFRAGYEDELERLKNRLLAQRLGEAWGADESSQLRRAANEAAALAWLTKYPLLVFPVLFEEKAESSLARAEQQDRVRRISRELLGV
jgi:hypothetical protein